MSSKSRRVVRVSSTSNHQVRPRGPSAILTVCVYSSLSGPHPPFPHLPHLHRSPAVFLLVDLFSTSFLCPWRTMRASHCDKVGKYLALWTLKPGPASDPGAHPLGKHRQRLWDSRGLLYQNEGWGARVTVSWASDSCLARVRISTVLRSSPTVLRWSPTLVLNWVWAYSGFFRSLSLPHPCHEGKEDPPQSHYPSTGGI